MFVHIPTIKRTPICIGFGVAWMSECYACVLMSCPFVQLQVQGFQRHSLRVRCRRARSIEGQEAWLPRIRGTPNRLEELRSTKGQAFQWHCQVCSPDIEQYFSGLNLSECKREIEIELCDSKLVKHCSKRSGSHCVNCGEWRTCTQGL